MCAVLLTAIAVAVASAAVVGAATSSPVRVTAGVTLWPSVPMNGVSCVAVGECAAVGYSEPAVHSVIVEDVHGSWGVPTVVGTDREQTYLDVPLCTRDGSCVAMVVGQHAVGVAHFAMGGPLDFTENMDLRYSPYADFMGEEACSSVTSCWQTYLDGSQTKSSVQALGFVNGRWLVPASLGGPYGETGGVTQVNGISCWAANSCTFVGQEFGQTSSALPRVYLQSERDGRLVGLTNPPHSSTFFTFGQRDVVSCSGFQTCLVGGHAIVGRNKEDGTVEEIVSGRWSPEVHGIGMSATATSSIVQDVSCHGLAICVAAGESERAGGRDALFLQADVDHHWRAPLIVPADESWEGGFGHTGPNWASCPTTRACVVAGLLAAPGGAVEGFVATYEDATWHLVRIQLGPRVTAQYLGDGSCVSTTCYVVGTVLAGSTRSGFVLPVRITP